MSSRFDGTVIVLANRYELAQNYKIGWQQFFKSDRDRRDLVTCGCAAGVAAAFRGGQIMVFLEAEKGYRSLIKIVIALGEDPPRVGVHCVG
ncbi:predicted protein [Arabidopsis lyrata subsp. lyrata]|uniref:Predicted protein n=1 Tax=Arabidopsis lyrata subsp. lyrata TaxID=81972 RepID=D7M6V1_ARALL|nr:predicted protein [Arabidopsis lyrata subsp. lyrata]